MTRDDAPVREECVPHPVNNCTMKTREKVGPHVISSSVICSSCFSVGTWWGRCACPWPWRAAPRSPGRSALECPSQSAWMLRGSSASSGQGRLAPQSRSGLLSFHFIFQDESLIVRKARAVMSLSRCVSWWTLPSVRRSLRSFVRMYHMRNANKVQRRCVGMCQVTFCKIHTITLFYFHICHVRGGL